jgi:peptidoglycan/xylan/chitin deacetylase (PgdA/CDA1 family)
MSIVQGSRLILNFHGIGAKPDWVEADEAAYWCDDAATFEAILDSIPHASSLYERPVEITFDDGNLSDFTIAAKALSERGLTGSFFVCAGRIGHRGYLDQAAIADMVASGFKIGSHGWSHVDWRKSDDKTLDLETSGAKRKIEDIVGNKVEAVAIPFGNYDRRVLNKLGEFTTIYTSDRGLAPPKSRLVPRVSYKNEWADGMLIHLLSGDNALVRLKRSLRVALKQLR